MKVRRADVADRYKFHIDVDGFGWTARWRKELSTGSVVLKATLFVSLPLAEPVSPS
jgi:hypothetical protein